MIIEFKSESLSFIYEEKDRSATITMVVRTTHKETRYFYTIPRLLENIREVIATALQSVFNDDRDSAMIEVAKIFTAAARKNGDTCQIEETFKGYFLMSNILDENIYLGRID